MSGKSAKERKTMSFISWGGHYSLQGGCGGFWRMIWFSRGIEWGSIDANKPMKWGSNNTREP